MTPPQIRSLEKGQTFRTPEFEWTVTSAWGQPWTEIRATHPLPDGRTFTHRFSMREMVERCELG
jgi:hypothetical protein